MLNNYMALMLLDAPLDDMKSLIKHRNLASLPLGGRYRLIDFPLSNVSNAGITNVGIIGDLKNAASLTDHIGSGASWDLDRKNGGIFFLSKYNGNSENKMRDLETNLTFLMKSKQKNILIMSSDMIYSIDFKKVFEEHESDDRDVTVIYKSINDISGKYYQATTIEIDTENTVKGFGINLLFAKKQNISLGAFIISKSLLIKLIGRQIEKYESASIGDLVLKNMDILKVKGYEYTGYLAQIKSIKEYYDFNMDLLYHPITESLFNSQRPIYTKRKDTPPTLFKKDCEVENSLISNGCQIKGTIRNSVIGRRVIIEKGAIVENCVILQSCIIKSGAHLRSVIVDKNNIITEGQVLNSSPAYPLVIEKQTGFNRKIWNAMIRGESYE